MQRRTRCHEFSARRRRYTELVRKRESLKAVRYTHSGRQVTQVQPRPHVMLPVRTRWKGQSLNMIKGSRGPYGEKSSIKKQQSLVGVQEHRLFRSRRSSDGEGQGHREASFGPTSVGPTNSEDGNGFTRGAKAHFTGKPSAQGEGDESWLRKIRIEDPRAYPDLCRLDS
ncbi:hypothetical protein Ancab_003896 [Ancistrocladus abbreviatus]